MSKRYMGKRGIIIGSLIAILLLYYHSSGMLEQIKRGIPLTSMDISFILGVVLGGAISGFIIENYFIRTMTKKVDILGCVIVGILISPMSFYLGIVSTPFGVALGNIFDTGTIMNKTASNIGICLSIIIMVIIVEVIGAAIGATLGSLGGRLIQDFKH